MIITLVSMIIRWVAFCCYRFLFWEPTTNCFKKGKFGNILIVFVFVWLFVNFNPLQIILTDSDISVQRQQLSKSIELYGRIFWRRKRLPRRNQTPLQLHSALLFGVRLSWLGHTSPVQAQVWRHSESFWIETHGPRRLWQILLRTALFWSGLGCTRSHRSTAQLYRPLLLRIRLSTHIGLLPTRVRCWRLGHC